MRGWTLAYLAQVLSVMKFGVGIAMTTILVVFFAPWGLLVATTYWVVVAVQRYRNQIEESGENFENKNSLGLPFTSRR